jgi:3-phosphoshikimate 1-carboxyvinyltransferase
MDRRKLLINPVLHAKGEITLPGSKSISNRVLLLSALASGKTMLHGLLDADDTRVMQAALSKLGVQLQSESYDSEQVLQVNGCNGKFPNMRADLLWVMQAPPFVP